MARAPPVANTRTGPVQDALPAIKFEFGGKFAQHDHMNWEGNPVSAGAQIGVQVSILGIEQPLQFTNTRNIQKAVVYALTHTPGGGSKMINNHLRPTFYGGVIFNHSQDTHGFTLSMEQTNTEVMLKYIVFMTKVLTDLGVPQIDQLPDDASIPDIYERNEIRLTLNCNSEIGTATDATIRGSAKVHLQWVIDQCQTAHPSADPSESVVSMNDLKVIIWPVIMDLRLIVRSYDGTNHFTAVQHADLLILMSSE
jgi:hypothetical protein